MGAVVVLFLFVVMFLDNPQADEDGVLAVAQHSGGLLPYLVVWLIVCAPFLLLVGDMVDDFMVVGAFLDPSRQVSGFAAGPQDILFDTQLPILQYFFTQGAALLFFMGLLFTLALFFALFLILVFAL